MSQHSEDSKKYWIQIVNTESLLSTITWMEQNKMQEKQ